jgi:hypothetical protein
MTALDRIPDAPEHYRAADFDTLADSPIVAGNPLVHQFDVDGRAHAVVQIGDVGGFDGARAAADLKKIVEAHRKLWGELPYRDYKFLLAFRPGGGGLEHKDSTLATTRATVMQTPTSYLTWLNFISHEYCHAFNVKRLRPIELGPFDYEQEPHTPSLWISEGFTSYFGELAVRRAGLSTRPTFSSRCRRKSTSSRSRREGSRRRSSSRRSRWTSESISGREHQREHVRQLLHERTDCGFLLDARIRRATGGAGRRRNAPGVPAIRRRARASPRTTFVRPRRKSPEPIWRDGLKRTVSSTRSSTTTTRSTGYGLRFAAGT